MLEILEKLMFDMNKIVIMCGLFALIQLLHVIGSCLTPARQRLTALQADITVHERINI